MRTRSRFVVLAALLALVAFGGVLTETAFVHTDDGCESNSIAWPAESRWALSPRSRPSSRQRRTWPSPGS